MGDLVAAGGKAALSLGDDTMLAHVCHVLLGEAGRVIIVAAKGQPLPPLPAGVEITRDTTPDRGPLSAVRDGLAYALARQPRPAIAVLCSCDVPGLSPRVVQLLVQEARASDASWIIPLVGGHPQVLVSAVTATVFDRILSEVTSLLTSPRALVEAIQAEDSTAVLLLSEAELGAVDPGLASFADIDTPDDLAKARSSPE
jgi:molybdopterin-guanine dinucleotide biosynthesis protein A